ELRMICRACRYEKCVEAGMKRHCVQKRRPNKKKDEEEDEDPANVVSPLAQYELQMAGASASIVKNEPISPSMFTRKDRIEPASEEDIERKDSSLPVDDYLLPQPHSSSVDSYTEEDPSAFTPSTSFGISAALFNQNVVPHLSHLTHLLPPRSPSFSIEVKKEEPTSTTTTPPSDVTTLADVLCLDKFSLAMSSKELLNHFVQQEKQAMDRRRMMFTSDPMRAFTDPDGTVPYSRSEIKPHTLKGQAEAVKFDHFLGYEYCRNMPFLDRLSGSEKIQLYRICALGFSVLDIGYISSCVMNDEESILVFTDGTYSTCGQDDFSVGWEDEDIITKSDKIRLFLEFNHDFFNEVIMPMKKMRMDRFEHAALKAICSWKLGLLEFPHDMKMYGSTIQTKVIEGLLQYYAESGVRDGDIRVGTIVLLMGNLFRMYAQVTEMYKQLDLFDLLKVDHITKALLCV
ncbi:hypothetical protein PFISCL1PPCAC_10156, partial [Pristionchus fissidentatus]